MSNEATGTDRLDSYLTRYNDLSQPLLDNLCQEYQMPGVGLVGPDNINTHSKFYNSLRNFLSALEYHYGNQNQPPCQIDFDNLSRAFDEAHSKSMPMYHRQAYLFANRALRVLEHDPKFDIYYESKKNEFPNKFEFAKQTIQHLVTACEGRCDELKARGELPPIPSAKIG